jgi:hypothetical protein
MSGKVRLRCWMVLDGKVIPVGSELDKELIPLRLRKRLIVNLFKDSNRLRPVLH